MEIILTFINGNNYWNIQVPFFLCRLFYVLQNVSICNHAWRDCLGTESIPGIHFANFYKFSLTGFPKSYWWQFTSVYFFLSNTSKDFNKTFLVLFSIIIFFLSWMVGHFWEKDYNCRNMIFYFQVPVNIVHYFLHEKNDRKKSFCANRL